MMFVGGRAPVPRAIVAFAAGSQPVKHKVVCCAVVPPQAARRGVPAAQWRAVDEFKINVDEISLEPHATVIGGGTSGDVHRGVYRGSHVAIKTPRPNLYEIETLTMFAHEVWCAMFRRRILLRRRGLSFVHES
jgi:hypothetical protein